MHIDILLGEVMRGAVCSLLEAVAVAELPLESSFKLRLLESIEATLPHPNVCYRFYSMMTAILIKLFRQIFNEKLLQHIGHLCSTITMVQSM